MKPVIGLPQMGNDLFRRYMKSKYVQTLRRAGAQARWIALEDPEQAAAEILACDGLLLPGGADVNPRLYGQEPAEACGKPDEKRDAGERKMLEAFLQTGKPILCICRGEQLLNVYFGGTLHQDIKPVQTFLHSHIPSRSRGIHPVSIKPDTKLGQILQAETLTVNSLHHQAADRTAPGLVVAAVSPDGFTEALEKPDHPFCIGVQWHPEHMSRRDPRQQELVNAFVRACVAQKETAAAAGKGR